MKGSTIFSSIVLELLLIWVFQKVLWKKQGIIPLLLLGALSAGLLLLPIAQLSIAHWIMSFSSSSSVPLLGLLFIAILEHAFSQKFFSAADWKIAWFFGVGMALLLYPSALGLGKIDVYTWGWHSSWLLIGVGAFAVLPIFLKNRFSLLLILAFVAYLLKWQSSTNFWDYLIDPFYAIVALGSLSYLFLKSKS